MVELALEGARALVGETADVPPVQKLLPLGVDDRAPQPDGASYCGDVGISPASAVSCRSSRRR